MLRRLIGEPELSTCDRHLGNNTAILAIDAEQLFRTKRRLIEGDGTRAIPNGKHCRNRGFFVRHEYLRAALFSQLTKMLWDFHDLGFVLSTWASNDMGFSTRFDGSDFDS